MSTIAFFRWLPVTTSGMADKSADQMAFLPWINARGCATRKLHLKNGAVENYLDLTVLQVLSQREPAQ